MAPPEPTNAGLKNGPPRWRPSPPGPMPGLGGTLKTPLQEATGRLLVVISQLANASREPSRLRLVRTSSQSPSIAVPV